MNIIFRIYFLLYNIYILITKIVGKRNSIVYYLGNKLLKFFTKNHYYYYFYTINILSITL